MSLGPLMVDVAGKSLTPEDREVLRHPLVGSVILFTRNYQDPEQLGALVAGIRALRAPPLLVAVDHEGGRVQRFRSGFSVLPPARRIGQEYVLDARQGLAMARQLAWLMASELRVLGIDYSFAPCVDLDYGVSEIIGDRAYHADPEIVSKLALATMQGMREAGMAATAKHFPGHGAVVADSHLALPVDRRSPRRPRRGPHALSPADPQRSGRGDDGPCAVPGRGQRARQLLAPLGRGTSCAVTWISAAWCSPTTSPWKAPAPWVVWWHAPKPPLPRAATCCRSCNRRESVTALLDGLKSQPGPASQLRVLRMRGKEAPARATLLASRQYKESRECPGPLRAATGTHAELKRNGGMACSNWTPLSSGRFWTRLPMASRSAMPRRRTIPCCT